MEDNNDIENETSREIQCPIHKKYKIQQTCINKDCPEEQALFCAQCLKENMDKHIDHRQDILGFLDMEELQTDLEKSKATEYQEVQNDLCLSFKNFVNVLDNQIEEIINQVRQSLNTWKENLLEKYQDFKNDEQECEKINQEELQNLYVPINKFKQLIQDLESEQNISKQKLIQEGEKIKNLFWSEEILERKQKLSNLSKKIKKQQKVKDNTVMMFNYYKKQILKNLENDQNISKNLDLHNLELIKPSINNFFPSEYNNSQEKVNLENFQQNGEIKFLDNKSWKVVYSNPFKSEDTVAFRITCPTINYSKKNSRLYFGVVEDQNKNSDKHNYGDGNWVNVDGKQHYKELSFNINGQNLKGYIEGNTQILVVINPSNSIFNIVVLDVDNKVVIKNQRQFENLEENQNWVFMISDGENKNVIIDNSVTNQDLHWIQEFKLLEQN